MKINQLLNTQNKFVQDNQTAIQLIIKAEIRKHGITERSLLAIKAAIRKHAERSAKKGLNLGMKWLNDSL